MSQILTITLPIYAAIALGYLIVAKGWFTAPDMRTMGKYVLNIALPALLFNAVASRDIAEVFHPGYMLVFLSGGLATIAIAGIWFTATDTDKARRAVAVMGSTCPNSGFVGYPVMLLVFPDIAGVILALNMLVENFVLIPVCLVLMEMAKPHRPGSIPGTIGLALLGVLKRPMVLGLLAGLVVSLAQIPVPQVAGRLFTMLAASASALSLLVVGGSMVGLKMTGHQWRAVQVAFAKLLVHPALVALAAIGLPVLGLAALPPDMHSAVILSAAMPMFGIYTVLSQELGQEGLASVAMLTATALAFFSLSVLLVWLT